MANVVKLFGKNTTCIFIKNWKRIVVRWRFFPKPIGLELDYIRAAGEGNNRNLLTFLFFLKLNYSLSSRSRIIHLQVMDA